MPPPPARGRQCRPILPEISPIILGVNGIAGEQQDGAPKGNRLHPPDQP
jgi:hypothetical protein